MPIRKAPQPEEARKLFLTHPNKTLQDWADMWGTTAERVRQIRHESGVGAVFKLDMKVVEKVCEHISTGKFTLADREMYKSLPVGLEAFKTWMRENEQVMIAVTDAQTIAKKNKLNPMSKECIYCKTNKDISEYKKNQKFVDGYNKVCTECLETIEFKKPLKHKTCLSCKKEKSKKSFTNNKKFKDGLVPFCKTCKSKMRRAKRTLNTKVADNI